MKRRQGRAGIESESAVSGMMKSRPAAGSTEEHDGSDKNWVSVAELVSGRKKLGMHRNWQAPWLTRPAEDGLTGGDVV